MDSADSAAEALSSASAAASSASTAATTLADRYTKAETDAKIVELSPPTDISGKLDKTNGTMTGNLTITGSDAHLILSDQTGSPTNQNIRLRHEPINSNNPNNEDNALWIEDISGESLPCSLVVQDDIYANGNKKVLTVDGDGSQLTGIDIPAYSSMYSTAHHQGATQWPMNTYHTGPNGSLTENMGFSVNRVKITIPGVYYLHFRGWDVYTDNLYNNDGYRFNVNGVILSPYGNYVRNTSVMHYSDFYISTTVRLAVNDLVGMIGAGADSGVHAGSYSAFTITKVSK